MVENMRKKKESVFLYVVHKDGFKYIFKQMPAIKSSFLI